MNCWPSGKYVHLLYIYSILGRGSSGYELNTFVRFSLISNCARRKRSNRKCLFCSPLCFQLVFLGLEKDFTTFTSDLYVERATDPWRITINWHSCFHSCWPNSKMKLKWNHIWKQGGPMVFRGPTQLAYSAYREEWLWYGEAHYICCQHI